MEMILIPKDVPVIVSSSSKGDQTKWLLGNSWGKESTRGNGGIAEYVAYHTSDYRSNPLCIPHVLVY